MISTEASERFLSETWMPELEPDSRRALLGVVEEGRAEAGAVLLAEGQPNDRVMFLLSGTVAITRNYAQHGEELLTQLAAPTVFGVTSFFGPNPPLSTARADSAVWYLTLDRAAYQALGRLNPEVTEQLARAAVRILSDRFDLLDRKLSEYFAHQTPSHRVSEWNAFRARLFEETSL